MFFTNAKTLRKIFRLKKKRRREKLAIESRRWRVLLFYI